MHHFYASVVTSTIAIASLFINSSVVAQTAAGGNTGCDCPTSPADAHSILRGCVPMTGASATKCLVYQSPQDNMFNGCDLQGTDGTGGINVVGDKIEFGWKVNGGASRAYLGNMDYQCPDNDGMCGQDAQGNWVMDGNLNNTSYFWNEPLVGKSISYTVDFGGWCDFKTCTGKCNLYVMLINIGNPSSEAGGAAPPSNDVLYCDSSNKTTVCTEIDLMEATQWGLQSTVHMRQPDNLGDQAGCAVYAGDQVNNWGSRDQNCATERKLGEYGPGEDTIDTKHPFTVTCSFNANGTGVLNGIQFTLSQDDGNGGSRTMELGCIHNNETPGHVRGGCWDCNGVQHPDGWANLSDQLNSGEWALAFGINSYYPPTADKCNSTPCPTMIGENVATISDFTMGEASQYRCVVHPEKWHSAGDANEDGCVNIHDLIYVIEAWGTGCGG